MKHVLKNASKDDREYLKKRFEELLDKQKQGGPKLMTKTENAELEALEDFFKEYEL